MSDYDDYDDDDDASFIEKHRFAIFMFVVLLVAGGVGLTAYFFTGKIPPPRKPVDITISLPPLPPPPPPPPIPPPKIPPPPEQKMVLQPPVKPNEPKPKDMVKSDKPPGPPGPKAGPPSDNGLANGGGGGGDGGDGEGGSRFGWYAGIIVNAIQQALKQNSQTRDSSIHHLPVSIWIDSTGRVTRAALSGSTGDPAIDDALKNQILIGVQLSEPPPSDMPMPVHLAIEALRPQ